MPWTSRDAKRHTHRAKSARRQRQWSEVANSVLRRTGDEGAAVRAANGVVRKTMMRRAGKRVSKRKVAARHSHRRESARR